MMPTYGICHLTLIPMRKEPAERSEMTSQLLFGETFEIQQTQGAWILIRTHFDKYSGWISKSMLMPLSADKWNALKKASSVILKDPVCKVSSGDTPLTVSFLAGGSSLTEENGQIMVGEHALKLESGASFFRPGNLIDLIATAKSYLNSPYLWGGRTAFGIDCSGFTQVVFKSNGIVLPRDAYQQAEKGKTITIDTMQPGDLAFFENESGRIMHTGIILENHEIIHSSGKVHIDRLDKKGIFSYKSQEYTHKLRIIKRVV
jgi:hypothetical protein